MKSDFTGGAGRKWKACIQEAAFYRELPTKNRRQKFRVTVTGNVYGILVVMLRVEEG